MEITNVAVFKRRLCTKVCYYHISQLCCIRRSGLTSIRQLPVPLLPLSFTPSLITVNLYHKLPKSQLSPLQQIRNSLARTVVKALKSCHITSILHSLHWLRITERIKYKLLSLTYKVLTTTQPPYLNNLISVQCPRSTRSSSVVTLARLPTSYSLKITNCSLRCAASI